MLTTKVNELLEGADIDVADILGVYQGNCTPIIAEVLTHEDEIKVLEITCWSGYYKNIRVLGRGTQTFVKYVMDACEGY